MTDGKLDVDNITVNPDYKGNSEDRDAQAIDELLLKFFL